MLRIQEDALWVVKQVYRIADVVERKDRDLARQMRRAGASMVLNLGEGSYGRGGTRRVRWHDSMGSGNEVRNALLLAEAVELSVVSEELMDRLDKVIATLWKLTR